MICNVFIPQKQPLLVNPIKNSRKVTNDFNNNGKI